MLVTNTECRLWLGALMVALCAPSALGQGLYMTSRIDGTFIDISGFGTPMGLGDDGLAQAFPAFDLTGTLFSGGGGQVWVSNNGAIGFLVDATSGAWWSNQPIPTFALFGGAHGNPQALAVYWDDLDSDTGDVYYATLGDPGSQVFVVQWQDRPHYPGDPDLDGDEITVQVQIFEAPVVGVAQMLYLDVTFDDPALDDGASATIGYQSNDIRNDVMWSFNQPGVVTAGTVLTLEIEPAPLVFISPYMKSGGPSAPVPSLWV